MKHCGINVKTFFETTFFTQIVPIIGSKIPIFKPILYYQNFQNMAGNAVIGGLSPRSGTPYDCDK